MLEIRLALDKEVTLMTHDDTHDSAAYTPPPPSWETATTGPRVAEDAPYGIARFWLLALCSVVGGIVVFIIAIVLFWLIFG